MTPVLLELMAPFFPSQGLGLFAARDIEKQTMVIEYNGTILRNEVALSKEKTYRAQVNTCHQLLSEATSLCCFAVFWFLKKENLTVLSPTEPSRVHVPYWQRACCWRKPEWRAGKVQWDTMTCFTFHTWEKQTDAAIFYIPIQKYPSVKY